MNARQSNLIRENQMAERPVTGTLFRLAAAAALIALWLISGCSSRPVPVEQRAQERQQIVAKLYRPDGVRPQLPTLTTNSPLHDFLLYAILNQPEVEASYYDWAASVQRITVDRSLPDPQFTFQGDIADTVMAVMPGLMQTFPGPGKLKLQARATSAESDARYHVFEGAVLKTAFDLKRAYYRLHFLGEQIHINRQTMALLTDLEKLARSQNEVGKVTLQDVLRAQIEQDRLGTDIANLADSRQPLMSQFKAALGLTTTNQEPPFPTSFETTPVDLTSGQLLTEAFARNPRLKAMEADVRKAEVDISLAYKARVPDFGAGLMADAKAAPAMFRPLFGMTLPIWRDKIAAEIAVAQGGKQAAEARLGAEQIRLTVDFAEKSFTYREVTRNLELLRGKLLPKAQQSLEIARGSYLSGRVDFFNLIDAERMLLNFQLAEVDARVQRELVLAELSLMILGTPPADSPLTSMPDATLPQVAPADSRNP